MRPYDYARVYSLDGIQEFIDIYGEHGDRGANWTPSIGDRGYMAYATAAAQDVLGNVAMCERNTPLQIQQAIEAALNP